jgi:trimeric autotransporter adhesin
MSTKTTFKRVALVAVAALSMGVLTSVTPANAAAGDITPTLGLVLGSASTTATATGVVNGQVRFTMTPTTANDDVAHYITTDSAGSLVTVAVANSTHGTVVNTNGTNLAGGATWTPAGVDTNTVTVTATASAAGTNVISVRTINGTTGASTLAASLTITWVASVSASTTSTAFINGAGVYAASNTTTAYSAKGTSRAALIGVALKDASGNALVGQKLTVAVTGPGVIAVTQADSLTVGTYATHSLGSNAGIRAATDSSAHTGSHWLIDLFGDGASGTSTVTISVGSTVVATKTWVFTDTATKITVTQNYSVARASATGAALGSAVSNESVDSTNVAAFVAFVEDKNGNGVNSAPSCKIADLTVINGCTITQDAGAEGAGDGYYNVSVTSAPNGVSGKSTEIYVRWLNTATNTYVESAPLKFTLGGSIATTSVTLDAASYEAGAPMSLSITAKDSSGNPTYDGQSIAYALSSSKPVGGALPATTKVFAKGVYATSLTSPTLYAPVSAGEFSISVTGNDTAKTVTTVRASVTNPGVDAATDAANEATDAANAATDAALAAADAADAATAAAQDASDAVAALSASVSKLISSLRAQITSLTNLVIKIQKKVRA